MARIEITSALRSAGCDYPKPYDVPCRDRVRQSLGDAAGLTQFGVNLLHLPPGTWSSQRHWHSAEDEFVWILEGEVFLVTQGREEILRTGDCAGFKARDPNGHHLQNRSDLPALILEVGSLRPHGDVTEYFDIDLRYSEAVGDVHKDGTPY
jgi:uncharacterized cupin superfamily protein